MFEEGLQPRSGPAVSRRIAPPGMWYLPRMSPPEEPVTYRCECGELMLIVAGPSWLAWDLMAERAEEHAETCPVGCELEELVR